MQEQTGWLFDYYSRGSNMVFWFIPEQDHRRLRLVQPYFPSCFVKMAEEHPGHLSRKGEGVLAQFKTALRRSRSYHFKGETTRLDFWTGKEQLLHEIQVVNLEHAYPELLNLYRRFPEVFWFNCDLPYEQLYAYTHNLFPSAYCQFCYEGEKLLECTALESAWETDYPQMPLRTVTLHGESMMGAHSVYLKSLALEGEEQTLEWDTADLQETLLSLNSYLEEWDPDLIWTVGGDQQLMPCLFQLADRFGIQLHLDREPGIQRQLTQRGRSYQSYGRIVYRDPDYPLWGRWHIDKRNSFLAHESDLDGLIEASRVSRLPVQRMARRSVGTGISSVQMAHVVQQGYPIPWKKVQPEAWKSALQLIRSDRGGLTFQPIPGAYENVVELDFVSMYPSIMTHFNVSPETINCACCPESRSFVPELGYRICEKRSGLISGALVPLLEKRVEYKRRMKASTDPAERLRYRDRQQALKWFLVCCFGYLGYKNARFGRIEAHESICAFSREMLLRTRHLCEQRGYQVLHSLVDCVWLLKSVQSHADVLELCRIIEEATQLPIAVEGHYSWLVFLSSTQHDDLPVPARYFGRFEDGTLKYRGIELRRNDQALFVQNVQEQLLDILSTADSLVACRKLAGELRAVVAEAECRLTEGNVSLYDVLLRRRLSRSAEEYRSNAMTATASRQALKIGKKLVGGQEVHFVVVNSKAGNPDERIRLVELLQPETRYDPEFYLTQLHRAADTILKPLLGEGVTPTLKRTTRKRLVISKLFS
jgi:DNA polymerase-2